jgi:hypothetical protein
MLHQINTRHTREVRIGFEWEKRRLRLRRERARMNKGRVVEWMIKIERRMACDSTTANNTRKHGETHNTIHIHMMIQTV